MNLKENERVFFPKGRYQKEYKVPIIYLFAFFTDPNNMTILNRTFQDEPLIME